MPRHVGLWPVLRDKCGQIPGYCRALGRQGSGRATRPGVLRAATQHEILAHVSHRRPRVCPRGLSVLRDPFPEALGASSGCCHGNCLTSLTAGASLQPQNPRSCCSRVIWHGWAPGSQQRRCESECLLPPPRCPSSSKGPPVLLLGVAGLPASCPELAVGRMGPGLELFSCVKPGEGIGNPLQYSRLENPMDRV